MEYYNNILCISKPELTTLISDDAYDQYVYRHPNVRVRRGSPAGPALLSWDHLRMDLQKMYVAINGDPRKMMKRNALQEMIEPDYKAATWFKEFQFDDETGIKPERQAEYSANASVLNAVGRLLIKRTGERKKLSNRTNGIWAEISDKVNSLDEATRERYPHTLPSHPDRLKEKYNNYSKLSYHYLVHKGSGNSNSKKVTQEVERLIISLYCMKNLPFGAWVHDDYMQFISGNLTIVDEDGVMFDREDFRDPKRGTYIMISAGTVWTILHDAHNEILVDRIRNNRIDHITQITPYNHRHVPLHSLSKISMDDRIFSRKSTAGNWEGVYVAYDVLSGCVLGSSYKTGSPTVEMVWECFRDLYHTVASNNLMWPGEVEIENHLMKEIETEVRAMFSYVTFCTPGLGRSKRAEHLHKAKKYGDEKRHQVGIGRHNLKGAYKIKSERQDDEYKQVRIPREQIIADDKESIQRYNHGLHPNQKLFKGKTRWQVLLENMNPDLSRPQMSHLFRYLGMKTETSIRNNDFCRVMYQDYGIDNLAYIGRLKPNNKTIEAYYLPDADGNIGEVFMYQDDTFISKATKIEKYNEAKMERTADDERIRMGQAKRQAHFFKVERDGIAEKVSKNLQVVRNDEFDVLQNIEVKIVPQREEPEMDIEAMIAGYSGGWTEKALEEI